MSNTNAVQIELKKDELNVLKEILENEVINLSVFLKKKSSKQDKSTETQYKKLKTINTKIDKIQQQLGYAGSL